MSIPNRLGWGLILVSAWILNPHGQVFADRGSEIAIVGLPPQHALSKQIEAELAILGFKVKVAETSVQSFREVQQLARQMKVAAAIWISTSDQGGLEIWVVDLVTGKTVQRTIGSAMPTSSTSLRVVTMKTIELLRASFRELDPSRHPPQQSEVLPSAPVQAMVDSSQPPLVSHRLSLNAGPALAVSPGGLAPSIQVRLGLRWFLYPRLGLNAFLLLPTWGVVVDEEEGSARIFISSLGVGPHLLLTDPKSRWQPDLGVGVGAAFLIMKGRAEKPLKSQTEVVTTAVLYARFGLSFRVNASFNIHLDLQSGALLPKAEIYFSDRRVATWGQPFGTGTLAAEYLF